MVDIYLKLQGRAKSFVGAVIDKELVSLLIARTEERPHLEEEKILYIDLAVTKRGRMKKGICMRYLIIQKHGQRKRF